MTSKRQKASVEINQGANTHLSPNQKGLHAVMVLKQRGLGNPSKTM